MSFATKALVHATLSLATVSCSGGPGPHEAAPVDAAEFASIAEEAYIYALPMLINYGTLYEFCVDEGSGQYKGPLNVIHSEARVCTPEDTTVVTPNSDTPYSMLWMDLRSEPMVLCVPEIEVDRYFSVQLIDLYTFNYGYVGSRTTGNGGGCYLVAGPSWSGEAPAGVAKVFRCETDFSFAIYRTQLIDPQDLPKVQAIQAGYTAVPLSSFAKSEAPLAQPLPDFPKFDKQAALGAEFIATLNFLLQYCPAVAEEQALRERFASIGIEAGKAFESSRLSPEQQTALKDAIPSAEAKIQARRGSLGKVANGWSTMHLTASRAGYAGDWQARAAVALAGIYANDSDEALYPLLVTDAAGAKPDCHAHSYTLTFPKDGLPPANAFWSVTMYDAKTQLLVANPIRRYLVNSAMLPELKTDPDGSITLHLQKDSPGPERESNWLPAPDGPIYVAMRLYWPSEEALSGAWSPPPLKKTQ